MWYKDNYRRIFMDMHINDDKEEYLSKFDPENTVKHFKECGAQTVVVKSRPHTGLAHHPTKYGRTHKGLSDRDYVKEMIAICRREGLYVESYFSQIFDNYVYDTYPEWRMVNHEGKHSFEYCDYRNYSMFRRGRYGLICPNNEQYREYVRNCLTELGENYDIDTVFLDMPFWPEVCYCESCKEKYRSATGKDMPERIDYEDKEFLQFQRLREQWMCDFTMCSTAALKAARPGITVEHNMSNTSAPWQFSTTDEVANACDYVSGDLYGGYLEQSFICKYYRNLTKAMPFVFITSRCEPGLSAHTTSKTADELFLHTMTALVQGGAFAVCDGINPDGTICEEAYTGILKEAFSRSEPYERYVSGDMVSDVAVFFPDKAKFNRSEQGLKIAEVLPFHDSMTNDFTKHPLNLTKILRQENIAHDVYPAGKREKIKEPVLALCDITVLRDEEMAFVEKYLMDGGNVYLSGKPGHRRLFELLEAEYEGYTEHNVTYMRPTSEGARFFESFSDKMPLNVRAPQAKLSFKGEYECLAHLTLPYTMTGTCDFASIHSNPPGEDTQKPCAVIKKVGKGKILWVAAAIESMTPYYTRKVVSAMFRELVGVLSFESDAPSFVEVVAWKKDEKMYIGLINQQEEAPFARVSDVNVSIPYAVKGVRVPVTGESVDFEVKDGQTKINIAKLGLFMMLEVLV